MRTPREKAILREVVEVHIASGEAVGSTSLVGRIAPRLSSASIRAVLSELGRQGLLEQPHTSAGRVPTDLGYRVYVDELMRAPLAPAGAPLPLDEGAAARELLRGAAHALSARTGLVTLVLAPRLERAILRRIRFVWLAGGRVLAIAVTREGMVHERLLRVGDDVGPGDLEGLTDYLNALLPGRTLAEVRAVIADEQRRDRDAHSELERTALELGRQAVAGVDDEAVVLVDGAAEILETKEFASRPAAAAALLRALEQRDVWLDLLDRVAEAEDIEVYVGHETQREELSPCGLVAGAYHAGQGVGVVALIGPKRLDYRRAIREVEAAARQLSGALYGPT